jgi:hypothetical protein
MEVRRAQSDEVGIVELGRFDPLCVPFDGMAHAEFEETLDKGPMTLTCGNVGKARPGDTNGANEEERYPSGRERRSNFDDSPGLGSQPPSHISLPKSRHLKRGLQRWLATFRVRSFS